MKIKKEFKTYCLKITKIVIEKFYKKKFENKDQEQLNLEATMLQVSIEKTGDAIKKSKNNSPISISEDMLIYMLGKNSKLFQLAYIYFEQSVKIKQISYQKVFEDWIKEKAKSENKNGIEQYFNTSNPHFNYHAYFWHIELRKSELFENITIPFTILKEYLNFKFNKNQPISTVDKIDHLMNEYDLNKSQRSFIYDKLIELIAEEEFETRESLAVLNIEISDRRWNLEPFDYQEEIKKYNIDLILEESKNTDSIEDQISFLRKKQLEFKSEEDESGILQELIDQIQIEIESLHLKLNRKNSEDGDYLKTKLDEIKANQNKMISSIDSIESSLIKFTETYKDSISDLQNDVELNFEKLFDSDEEKHIILKKLDQIAKENKKEEWYNQPIKSKIKIPLALFKYEKEFDLTNSKFPKTWNEFKQIFIIEKN